MIYEMEVEIENTVATMDDDGTLANFINTGRQCTKALSHTIL